MTKKEFPEAIKCNGVEEGEILFLSEERYGNKNFRMLMKADENSVTKVVEPVETGRELPIYIRLISSYIFTGMLGRA